MAKNILLRDGFARAAGILENVLDVAVESLNGQPLDKVQLEDLEELVTPQLDCNADERAALSKASGLVGMQNSSFVNVPGYAMGVLRERVEKKVSARANSLPQEALWVIAGAHVAGSNGQRMRAKKVADWVHSNFLLAGGRINSDLADQGLFWTLAVLGLGTDCIMQQPGVASLEKLAIKFAAQHQNMDVIDQFICCEIVCSLKQTETLPEEHLLRSIPLGAAPRYSLGYLPEKESGSLEPKATFRQVPEDLDPYIFKRIRE